MWAGCAASTISQPLRWKYLRWSSGRRRFGLLRMASMLFRVTALSPERLEAVTMLETAWV